MKALRLFSPYEFRLYDEAIPDIADHEVLLKIQAVGICGSDLHRYRGAITDDRKTPIILGHEFSATIEKTGRHVMNVRPGDRVAVEAGIPCGGCEWCLDGNTNLCPHIKFCGVADQDGMLREYAAWPAHLVYKLPSELSFEDGVLIEVLAIALHAVNLANMNPALTCAVLGSGPVGLAVLNLVSRSRGAVKIIAIDIINDRCNFAAGFGADHIMNAHKEDVVKEIMQLTNNRGVDVVFEAAGVEETCRQAVEICAPGGKVMWIGIPEDNRTPFSTESARRKGLTFRFVRRSKILYDQCISLMTQKIVDMESMVTHHFEFERTAEAFRLVDGYKDGVIKAIVWPSR
ncbi:alcohol dehydrogenase catalytic domain-containing protein [candidate division KSB1 bacterium]|nr:alcohol dehydrogenase catalytic domain-containing protein [candidate division KSB1 bacterium]